MAGRVISGKYANSTVYCDSDRMYLFIKNNGATISLEPTNITNYKLVQRNSLAGRQIYSVTWQDGSKSVIGIPDSWQTYLASGCEVGRLDDKTVRANKNQTLKGFLLGIAAFGVLFMLFFYIFTPHKPSDIVEGSYSEWDGRSAKNKRAEVLVETTDSIELSADSGAVSGYIYNESIRTFRHVEVIYGLYDSSGTRVGECLFSTNNAHLKSGAPLGFTAICNNWTENPTITLESVGFRTNS